MPVEPCLTLGAVVSLDDPYTEWEPTGDVVDETDGRALIAGVVNLQHPKTCAVIDGRELIETLLRVWDPLKQLHVQLEPEARVCLFVALPALRMRAMLLVRQ
jgi:hypothetical protein